MASLTINSARKYYGAVEALKGVSVDIADGEFVILVGPSGCGKSTLLRMIAGLEEISDGDILIGTRVVNDMPPKERDIAMVFQNYALYPHMTVADNMAFSLKLQRAPASEISRKVDRAAGILGLDHLLDRFPRQLSGGQRQRVAMGRAIVRDPSVFLFDEPLSNLDAKLRVQMRAEIKALHQRLKTTTVYVTHDQIEAMTMADKIVVMRDGVIEQAGFQASGGPLLPALAKDARAVTYGIRPEHLHLDPDGVEVEVVVVEPMGSETQLVGRLGPQQITIVFRQRIDAAPGDRIRVSPDLSVVHLFDAEGLRLG